ncbi:transglutaminase domain-containing protein [Methyloglobulus morosus KoM1]|uniref:Transglutaminase domain-containing protein n=1 Tax=Methyloglobulus morosus KoM1 TaxID=1116472 RepID=V5BTP1_9GAMM|nr:transglutaminase-like domain-containing protein [Methyloglobulus morosus]ESS71239.1 transglutaminase domain-containing protein [Methyloglobulus morosus KoM1]
MCMQLNGIRPYQGWNWSGDMIVHDTTIPASRKVPGTQIKGYYIDIREFVSIGGNSVIRKTLHEISDKWTIQDKLLFFKRSTGGFDFRADKIFNWFSSLDYIKSKRRFDQWLFPEETLAQNGGDCEDLSFLLASLLIESGISHTCVRVALGRIVDHTLERSKPHDHAWVMYQNESGAWQILDPLAQVKQNKKFSPDKKSPDEPKKASYNPDYAIQDIEYIPCFVFNPEHLWRVRSTEAIAGETLQDYLNSRNFWTTFDPSFAASVHSFIFERALIGMPINDLNKVKAASLRVDINVLAYDPRDHFDFAYVQESWDRINRRLQSGDLDDFGLAVHAIGDFYAHTLYAYFAPKTTSNRISPYDPANPIPSAQLAYDFTGLPMPGASLDAKKAAKLWQGQLISGQWWRWYTTYPSDLKKPNELQKHRNLPDHDCLAVDTPTPSQKDHFFVKNGTYQKQFKLRQQAAIEHVAQVYQMWRKKH